MFNRPRRLHSGDETRYPFYMEWGGSQGCSGTVVENLAPTRILSPDRPALSESLQRLSYSVPSVLFKVGKNNKYFV